MTPKEQALELYGKFFSNAESRNYIGLYDEDLHKYNAKQCALITVDEMIELCESYVAPYYYEVKQEIEKL
jgi:hypothetical protein